MWSTFRQRLAQLRGRAFRDESPRLSDEARWYTEHTALLISTFKWAMLGAIAGSGRLPGLTDAPRSGRPPVFTAADRAEAVALACALPAESGVPLSKWSCPELARELAARCQIAASASTVRRWLAGSTGTTTASDSLPAPRPLPDSSPVIRQR